MLLVSLGKPSSKIIEFIKKGKYDDRYSADDIAKIIDSNIRILPVETQQKIQTKINTAKIINPSLKDGCEELQAICLVEIAKSKGISVEEILGKPEPRTEDDDAKLTNAIK